MATCSRDPLTIEVENNRIRSLVVRTRNCSRNFAPTPARTKTAIASANSRSARTPPARDVIGNILQDEKIPGIHIAFGHPYAEHTGANWLSKTHIDCVGRDFDIWFDGEQGDGAGKISGVIDGPGASLALQR